MPKKNRKSYSHANRPKHERMCQILRMVRKGNYPASGILAEECGVKRKTILRDISFLRDREDLPIEYDQQKHGYFLTEPIADFPLLHISQGELVSIFIAQKALLQYHGTPFEQPLRAALQKLITSLKGEISVAWSDLESAISFRSVEANPADVKIFQIVSVAVQQHVEVEFDYKKLNSSSFEWRRVRPYHLACVNNQWYLFGHDLDRQEIRTFVLPRMRTVEATNRRFIRPKDFSIDQFLKGSFGVFSPTGAYEVKIEFDAFASQLIRERIWHPSRKITELANGGIDLHLKLTSLNEIEPWILSWGNHAHVREPEALKKSVIRTIKLMLRQH
jgi:predicted DNA-binding transcriptional regulator YafY